MADPPFVAPAAVSDHECRKHLLCGTRGPDRTAADRERRYRKRVASAARHVAGDVPADLIEALIERGVLPYDRADKHTIFAALLKAARAWVSRRRYGVTG